VAGIHTGPYDTDPQMTRLVIPIDPCFLMLDIFYSWGTRQDSNLHRGFRLILRS
jgi:hypothetical protein